MIDMKKAAVLLATGFEEGEALFIVDILRRANLTCDMVSIEDSLHLVGSHQIKVEADKRLTADINDYDMIILPGGLPGAENLRDDRTVIATVQTFNEEGKFVAAMCAAPIVLHKAGIVAGRTLTSYPGAAYKELLAETNYKEEIVVVDGNMITSRGPATTFAFAYTLVDLLGGDSSVLKEKMLYNMLEKSYQ